MIYETLKLAPLERGNQIAAKPHVAGLYLRQPLIEEPLAALRADIHTLFDLGLITVAPGLKLAVSDKLDGTDYAKLHGNLLRLPTVLADRPSQLALDWHRDAHGGKM